MSKKITKLCLCLLVLFSVLSIGSDRCNAQETKDPFILKKFNSSNAVTIKNTEIYSKKNGYVYVAYRAKYDGCIKLSFSKLGKNNGDFTGYSWICDYNKNTLGGGDYFTSRVTGNNYSNIYYGVKKNTIYLFKLKVMNRGCNIKISEYKFANYAGTTKEKAVSMTEKKNVTGFIEAGSDGVDYYKIVLSKSTKINFYYKGFTNGSIMIQITKPNHYTGKFYINYPLNGKWQGVVSKKLIAGTYIVKVSPRYSTSSGCYAMQWRINTTN